MSSKSAYDRRKDPQGVRAMLIAATAELICEYGLARVTVDAVATAAGVTKGGLFHHFPSKQALIDGVVETMIADADARIDTAMGDDPEPHGRFTRAFLNSVLTGVEATECGPVTASPRTLCLAMLADPNLLQRWTSWFDARVARHADTDGDVACAIVRLATDGIWLSSLHDPVRAPDVPPTVRDALFAMTRAGP